MHAVLTGDIILSRKLSSNQIKALRATLSDAAAQAAMWDPLPTLGGVDFFRGDAWQVLLPEAHRALRASIYVRARLRAEHGIDTRLAIGIGRVDVIEPHRISLSTGEAFILSGRALDEMNRYSDLTVALPAAAEKLATWLRIVAELCSALVTGWTRRQAEIVSFAILPDALTNEAVGLRLSPPVRKQTVTRALAGARWRAIRDAIEAFEAVHWDNVAGGKE